jgi:hypothetical protein
MGGANHKQTRRAIVNPGYKASVDSKVSLGNCGQLCQGTRGRYAKGRKSERRAVLLEAGTKRYVLRRKGGPAFADATLRQLVGHEVECDGFFVGSTLLAEKIELLEYARHAFPVARNACFHSPGGLLTAIT